MRKIKHLVVGLASLFAFGTAQVHAQRVGAYFPNWKAYTTTQAQFSKLTDAYWAFLVPYAANADGSGADGSFAAWDAYTEVPRFNTFKANCPSGVRKKISIGGDGDKISKSFSEIMANSNKRATFATNLANFVQQHNFDGVDIDWEHPKSADAANFALFLGDLKSKLNTKSALMGKPLELSIAVFATSTFGTEGITSSVISAVDYINIMAYDNTDQLNHSDYSWATGALVYGFWKNTKGVPASKLVLGLPFYGRPSYSPTPYNGQDVIGFNQVPVGNVDNDQCSYNGKTYYYNGKTTIANKVKFALQNGMMGVMFWELSQDRTDNSSLLSVIDYTISTTGGTSPDFGKKYDYMCGKTSYPLSLGSAFASGYSFTWKKDGEVINGETSSSYTATSGGVYEVFTKQNSSGVTKSAIIVLADTLPNLGVSGEMPLCAGQSVDLDADVNANSDGNTVSNISYVWKNGSSTIGTSSLVSVNSAAVYTVTATDSKGQCAEKTSTVTVTNTALKVQGDNVCAGKNATVKVLSSGGPFTWFDSQSSNLPLGYGSSYTAAVSSPTTFWVQNTGGSLNTTFSQPYSASGAVKAAGQPDYDYGDAGTEARLIFDASQTMRIDSISFWYNGDWAKLEKDTVTLTIYNSSNAVVYTKKQAVNTNSGKNRIFFGLSVPAGQGYRMAVTGPAKASGQKNGNNGLWCDKNAWGDNFAYPYTITGGLITITGTYAYDTWGKSWLELQNWYAGLYDISVSTGAPCPRVSVDVTTKACKPPVVTITTPSKDITVQTNSVIDITSSVVLNNTNLVSLEYIVKDANLNIVATLYGTGSNNATSWTPETKGNYVIVATAKDDNDNIVADVKNVTVTNPVGFEEVNFESNASVYPNPSNATFTLSVSDEIAESYTVSVINVLGTVVSTKNVTNQNTVTFGENLSAGIYLLQVSNGSKVLQTKVVKK